MFEVPQFLLLFPMIREQDKRTVNLSVRPLSSGSHLDGSRKAFIFFGIVEIIEILVITCNTIG